MQVLIWILVKILNLQIPIIAVNCQQHQPSSSCIRVLKNNRFQHSNVVQHDKVEHFTKCLAICNLKQQCGSVNYHGGLKKCIVSLGVTEDMKMDEDRMLDEDGWIYYEKDEQNIVSVIKTHLSLY